MHHAVETLGATHMNVPDEKCGFSDALLSCLQRPSPRPAISSFPTSCNVLNSFGGREKKKGKEKRLTREVFLVAGSRQLVELVVRACKNYATDVCPLSPDQHVYSTN